ncbi:MAG: TlpA family protein disulfide reductase, partial [Bacteroidales bacterium]
LFGRVDSKFIYKELLIGNENIIVEGDISDFPYDVTITGSKIQDEREALNNYTDSFYKKRDSLIILLSQLDKNGFYKAYRETWEENKILEDTALSLRIQYMKSYVNTYAGLIDLIDLMDFLAKDTVQMLYDQLLDELKESKYGMKVKIFLNNKVVELADKFYDFKAINIYGYTVLLSDLMDKYTLLYFTESHCGPCRMCYRDLKRMDQEIRDSVKVILFYVDGDKNDWLNSIKNDSIPWISLWDGKASFSETIIKYGIDSYPEFFLINSEGIIIDRWGGWREGCFEEKLGRFMVN